MKIKTAVVGSGLIATLKHLPSYGRLKDRVELVAVCDVNEERAREIASKFHAPNYYTDLGELLEREKPDLVDICTPPRTHVDLAIKALSGGANVMVEKPMAIDVEQCDRMISAAAAAGKQICVGHSDLFYRSFLRMREMVKAGSIGEFRGMRIFLLTPIDYITSKPDHWAHALPGGVVGETGPHVVYMTLAFIPSIKDVVVRAQKLLAEYPWSPFEDYRIELVGENATSSITLAYTTKHWAAQVEVWGTDGLIRADLETQSVLLYRRPSLSPPVAALSALNEPIQLFTSAVSNAIRYARRQIDTTHDLLLGQYVDSLLHGGVAPVTAQEGRESIRVMHEISAQLSTPASA